jgi:uncharacterized protein YkwD
MKVVFPIAFCALSAVGAHVQAQSGDVVRIVNRLRAPDGACAASAPPFVPHGALDAAATRLARGAPLADALKSAGYRVTEAHVIVVSGDRLHAELASLLTRRYCAQIGLPKLSEVGVYDSGNQIWIVLAAPFAPKVGLTRRQVAERTLVLVNQARAEPRSCGDQPFGAARPVKWNNTLEKAAARHAADMAANSYFSHTGRDGATPAQRVTRAGYRYRMTGENIASGQVSPEAAMAGWIKSPGHCANLMNGAYTEMGVSFSVNAASTMGVYWVQLFGTPR